MATMKDIARIAKVSTSTVSHVINGTRFVSDEIREKVMSVVQELNYRPSALARSFKLQQTKTIGMLVTASNNPFFAEVVAAVEHYCAQNDYNLILCNTDGDCMRLEKSLQTLLQKQVDGLLLMCTETHLQEHATVHLTVPTVIMDWWPTELNADRIFEDSELGGYLATKCLIQHGHRKIGIITGNLQKPLALNRLNGYKKALLEAQIPLNKHWIVESQFDFQGGVVGMDKLLQQNELPTAVFACSDTIALGIYQTAWRYNLRIPQDISVIGYDDINLSQYLAPPLATIHQPKVELGKRAVEMLLERIKSPERKNKTVILQPNLIVRPSVAPPIK
ncbi:LacI family transcriptional regulator [Pasteurella langaaensis DSM 22999]|uniref:Ribose operon repressor n=1 Tax=Alitibacter langaaensis DSM 22999 TaxID=1122935 RepID=A0A2U0T7T2_9PAST|nr:substrate-binding domain-containing protein [Pasteurella langaaensis]PVX39690.1 LacI family transcriptional regulator [Pasteurella langaaensis DSM 22999]